MTTGLMDRYFGTWRGMVRLGLSYFEVAGRAASVRKPMPDEVSRLVFVCHGNICRSAFADAVARKHGLRTASFGLSTASGNAANAMILDLARQMGIELRDHQTTALEDFVPQPGDYLLAMEARQLRRLAATDGLSELPRALLGSYANPPMPHLHDPYELNTAYQAVCLRRIENAVIRIAAAFPGARFSSDASDRAGQSR